MSMNLAANQSNELLYVGFNQDYGCFACGTDTGFVIYTCDPFKETFRRDFNTGGIGIVEMLFRCNILALVGGGRTPRYPSNKVMIWDDHQNRCIGELTFRSEVRAVKLRRDRVVVVLEYKIYVYNFSDLKLVDHIETIANPRGTCALCPSSSNSALACPGLQRGHVRVELYDVRKTTLIPAHETALSCLALNNDGTRVATSSEKGTLIRVYDTHSGMQLHELRRGAERADIYSICFNYNSQFVAVSSDRGTVHIFSLKSSAGAAAEESVIDSDSGASAGGKGSKEGNTRSSLSFMKGILPRYFSSEWSFAQYRLPDRHTICAFGLEKNTLIAIQSDGTFYKAKFDPVNGGDAVKDEQECFIRESGDMPAATMK